LERGIGKNIIGKEREGIWEMKIQKIREEMGFDEANHFLTKDEIGKLVMKMNLGNLEWIECEGCGEIYDNEDLPETNAHGRICEQCIVDI
jgi:hypothetical protein